MCYRIGNFDKGYIPEHTGYLIGEYFESAEQAQARADELNKLPHAPGRTYKPVIASEF